MLWLDKLREMKATSGKTTQEIAVETGVPEATLEKLFSGATKDPRINTITRVVHYLGYTLDDLVPSLPTGHKAQPLVLTTAERKLIGSYRRADDHARQMVDLALEPFAESSAPPAQSDVAI